MAWMAIPAAISAAASVYGMIKNSQNEDSAEEAQAREVAARQAAAAKLMQFAPQMEAADTNVLQNSMAGYAPLNNWMGATYGPGAKVDLAKMSQDPFKGTGYQAGK